MYDNLFQYKKFNVERALAFGFEKEAESYVYETKILEGQFVLKVSIANGAVSMKVLEQEDGEEYVLHRTNAEGTFVGAVREAVEKVLQNIAQNCFEEEVFKTAQAKELIRYVSECFRDEPEFLWKKFPANAIWRRKDNKKWYGAILTVAGNKIGLATKEIVEIIDLRVQTKNLESLLKMQGYYPGWHMNKKSWYTIVLDGTVPTEEIFKRIDESYQLAKK